MKKHIGVKMCMTIAVLVIVFFMNVVVSNVCMLRIRNQAKITSDVYLVLEEQDKVIIQQEETLKLYCNLIVMMDDTEMAAGIASSVAESVAIMDTAQDSMVALCQ